MKLLAVALLFLSIPLWGQAPALPADGVPGFAKDQFRYYALMHHNLMNQSFLLEDHLIWTFETWAAVGLYGPPTIHGNFDSTKK